MFTAIADHVEPAAARLRERVPLEVLEFYGSVDDALASVRRSCALFAREPATWTGDLRALGLIADGMLFAQALALAAPDWLAGARRSAHHVARGRSEIWLGDHVG
jgi:hypothetical protein